MVSCLWCRRNNSLIGVICFTSSQPHLFPHLPLPFRDNLDAYCMELRKLAIQLILLMGEALKVEAKEMRGLFEEGWQSVRMNYYPPCPQPEKGIGLNPHSDASALTILLQVNGMGGLQIKKDAIWVPINPLPNALVVNAGEDFEVVSNGIYKSIEHRATVNQRRRGCRWPLSLVLDWME